jgi:polysaccharide export outer membrane protein
MISILRGRGVVVLMLLLAFAGGCADRHAVAAFAAPPATAPAAPNSQYVIGPGDRLSVFVYESPQLGVTDLPVRPDGRISLPLIPDIVAAGKTPTRLGQDIAGRLAQYVKAPNVSVMVRDFYGPFDRQVRVIGEATEPQALPYRDHLTVLDVMIQTKGLTRFASGNAAIIVRRLGSTGRNESIKVRLSDLMKDGDIDANVEMQPGDTLIIPQSWF